MEIWKGRHDGSGAVKPGGWTLARPGMRMSFPTLKAAREHVRAIFGEHEAWRVVRCGLVVYLLTRGDERICL